MNASYYRGIFPIILCRNLTVLLIFLICKTSSITTTTDNPWYPNTIPKAHAVISPFNLL